MFQGDSFQVITTFNVLQYVENRQKLFKQFYKPLKPKGKLIVAAPCFCNANSLSTILVKRLRLVRIMPETYYFSIDEFEKELINIGFTIVEIINLSSLPEILIVASKE